LISLAAMTFEANFPVVQLILFESGGDNLPRPSLDLVDGVSDRRRGRRLHSAQRGPGYAVSTCWSVNKYSGALVGGRTCAYAAESERVRAAPVIATNAESALEWRRLPMQCLPASFQGLGRPHGEFCWFRIRWRRTVLRRSMSYPFHFTRAFQLDRMRPIWRRFIFSRIRRALCLDRRRLIISCRRRRALNLTTRHRRSCMTARGRFDHVPVVTVKPTRFLHYFRSYVLFPDADLHIERTATSRRATIDHGRGLGAPTIRVGAAEHHASFDPSRIMAPDGRRRFRTVARVSAKTSAAAARSGVMAASGSVL